MIQQINYCYFYSILNSYVTGKTLYVYSKVQSLNVLGKQWLFLERIISSMLHIVWANCRLYYFGGLTYSYNIALKGYMHHTRVNFRYVYHNFFCYRSRFWHNYTDFDTIIPIWTQQSRLRQNNPDCDAAVLIVDYLPIAYG